MLSYNGRNSHITIKINVFFLYDTVSISVELYGGGGGDN